MNVKRAMAALLALLLVLPAGSGVALPTATVINRRIASNNAQSLDNLPDIARARTDSLVIGVADLHGETNPFWAKTMGDHYLASLLFDEMLFQNNVGETGPGVASYAASADGKTYTFTIREGAKYFDGEQVSSDDFINALYLLLMPGFDGVYDITRLKIHGVDAYLRGETAAVEGIARVNDRVFSVTLDTPNMENLIFFAIPALRVSLFGDMCRPETLVNEAQFAAFYQETLARVRETDATEMTYGQYSLETMEAGVKATLTAHEGYWRGSPYIGTVELLVVPTDATSAVYALLDGVVDIINVAGSVDIVNMCFDSGFINLYTWEGDVLGYLGMDLENALFSDPSIREALAIGMDRAEMRKNTLERYALVPTALVFDSFAMEVDLLEEMYAYDPERAASLLDDAGWLMGEDGVRHRNEQDFCFTLTYNAPNPYMEHIAVQMQSDYRALGIDMQLEAVTMEEMMERVERNACDMYFQARKLPHSASLAVDLFAGSSHLNQSKYSSDTLARDIARATDELDPARQTVLYEGLFLDLYMELSIIPLYRRAEMLLISGRVMNAVITTSHEITSDVYRFFLVNTLEGQW